MDYEVTSFSESANGRGAQITVTVGEGGERRSFTRHLHRQGGRLMGLNIDPRAIPLNELYEQEFAEAKSELASSEVALKGLREKLAKVGTETPENINEAILLQEMKAELEVYISAAEGVRGAAADVAIDAEERLDIVRQELPLMMSFDTMN